LTTESTLTPSPVDPRKKIYAAYQQVLATGKYKHMVAHPGDVLPITGMKVTVISSDGNVIDHPLPGGGETNQYCSVPETKPMDRSEKFPFAGRSDQTLANSKFSIWVISPGIRKCCSCVRSIGWAPSTSWWSPHHGLNPSSSHALVNGIHPRVAIMNNAATKGGAPQGDRYRPAISRA